MTSHTSKHSPGQLPLLSGSLKLANQDLAPSSLPRSSRNLQLCNVLISHPSMKFPWGKFVLELGKMPRGVEEMTLVFHSQTQLCLSWRQIHKLAPLPVPEPKHLDMSKIPANFSRLWSKSEQGRCSAAMKRLASATRAWNRRRARIARM